MPVPNFPGNKRNMPIIKTIKSLKIQNEQIIISVTLS